MRVDCGEVKDTRRARHVRHRAHGRAHRDRRGIAGRYVAVDGTEVALQ